LTNQLLNFWTICHVEAPIILHSILPLLQEIIPIMDSDGGGVMRLLKRVDLIFFEMIEEGTEQSRPQTAPSSNKNQSISWPEDIVRPATATPCEADIPEPLTSVRVRHSASFDNYEAAEKTVEISCGDRVCVVMNGERCLGNLKYIGPIDSNPEKGIWCGIELDRPCKINTVFKNNSG
jgi:hypothetical protein